MFPRRLRSTIFGVTAVAVLLAACLWSPLFALYRVSGSSMIPAFQDGDSVLVTALPALFGGIEVGDTVIAEVDGEVLIKRVMGLPGDTLWLSDGCVFRGNLPAADPVPAGYRDHCCLGPRHLGGDEYFVLGDNRAVSVDSRIFGAVSRPAILGKVIHRFAAGNASRPSVAATKP